MRQRQTASMSALKVIATVLIGIVLSGCAGTSPMALKSFTDKDDLNDTSIGMFTLRTANEYKPSFQPSVASVEIVPSGSGKGRKFKVGKPYQRVKNEFYEYLVSVDLNPGTYSVGKVKGRSSMFPLIEASFQFPVDARFELPTHSLIDMRNRKREKGELRSGKVTPLIDQATAGYSGGTFDVIITDRSAADIPAFLEEYPFLKDLSIETVTMQ